MLWTCDTAVFLMRALEVRIQVLVDVQQTTQTSTLKAGITGDTVFSRSRYQESLSTVCRFLKIVVCFDLEGFSLKGIRPQNAKLDNLTTGAGVASTSCEAMWHAPGVDFAAH